MNKLDTDKITVERCGLITGIGRYTEIPIEALHLSENNMMFPDSAEAREFVATRSQYHLKLRIWQNTRLCLT